MKKRQRELLDRVLAALDAGGAKPSPPTGLATELHVPIQAVIAILEMGVESGEIVRLSNGFQFATSTLPKLAEKARSAFLDREFGTGELRDLFEISRETANAILEYWDAAGLTAKTGGRRRMKPSE